MEEIIIIYNSIETEKGYLFFQCREKKYFFDKLEIKGNNIILYEVYFSNNLRICNVFSIYNRKLIFN